MKNLNFIVLQVVLGDYDDGWAVGKNFLLMYLKNNLVHVNSMKEREYFSYHFFHFYNKVIVVCLCVLFINHNTP